MGLGEATGYSHSPLTLGQPHLWALLSATRGLLQGGSLLGLWVKPIKGLGRDILFLGNLHLLYPSHSTYLPQCRLLHDPETIRSHVASCVVCL